MTPVLPRGVRVHWDKVRETHVLLGPERALMLDPIATEILRRVDGEASEASICAELAETFGAPIEQVSGDVRTFLADLADKRLLDARDG